MSKSNLVSSLTLIFLTSLSPAVIAQTLSDPTRPPAAHATPVADKQADASETLVLHAIFFANGRRVAIVNDSRVSENDVVQSARVLSIKRDRVLLQRNGETFEISMKTEDVKSQRPPNAALAPPPAPQPGPKNFEADDPTPGTPREGKES